LVESATGPCCGRRQTALHLGQVTWVEGQRAIFCQWRKLKNCNNKQKIYTDY